MSLLDHYRNILAGYKTAVIDDVKEKLFGENIQEKEELNENDNINNLYYLENNVQSFDNISNIIEKSYEINIFVTGIPNKPIDIDKKEWDELFYKVEMEVRDGQNVFKIDYALTYDLYYARKNPNLVVLNVLNTEDLVSKINFAILREKIKFENTINFSKVYVKNIYISSHGGYHSPYFMIGEEMINMLNIEKVLPLKKVLNNQTNFVITACNTGAGEKPENAEKFICDIANILKTNVIAYRSWGFPKVTNGKYNLSLSEMNGIDNWETRLNSLLFMGQSIKVSALNSCDKNINYAFRINSEGNIEYMSETEYRLVQSLINFYNHNKNSKSKIDFYFFLYSRDKIINYKYKDLFKNRKR